MSLQPRALLTTEHGPLFLLPCVTALHQRFVVEQAMKVYHVMDTNRLALIFVMCANICLGAYVYLRGRKNAVNISFGILTLTIALWTFGVFMIVSIWRDSNPIRWVRITYAVGTFMGSSALFVKMA